MGDKCSWHYTGVFWNKSAIKGDSKALSKIILKLLVEKLKSSKILNKNTLFRSILRMAFSQRYLLSN